MEDARIFGVLSGEPDAPRVAYLGRGTEVAPDMLEGLGSLKPTEVFRFAGRCEESRCSHFDGARCTLAQRLKAALEPVVEKLPPCSIRPTCRWYMEQGPGICLRCPQITTLNTAGPESLREAATPPT